MIKKLLNIKYPIIQAPMLGVTSPKMVAECCNFGILGSLPVGGLSPQLTKKLINETKSLTNNRFAVNLFTNKISNDLLFNNKENYNKMIEFIINNDKIKSNFNDISTSSTLSLPKSINELKLYNYHDQIDILLEEGIDIISFTFGKLDRESIQKIKHFNPNSILIGTATCLKEGIILQDSGVDMICAQGIEAGGHRGSFINDNDPFSINNLPQVSLIPLVSSLLQATSIPIIAAGSITNKSTIDSLLSMGVAGVQIGSLFIASNESAAIESWKDEMINSNDTSTILTRSYSGRWARGIKNDFINLLENNLSSTTITIPPYPIQNEITKPLRSLSQKQNNNQFTNLWSGQLGFKTKKLPIKEILNELI